MGSNPTPKRTNGDGTESLAEADNLIERVEHTEARIARLERARAKAAAAEDVGAVPQEILAVMDSQVNELGKQVGADRQLNRETFLRMEDRIANTEKLVMTQVLPTLTHLDHSFRTLSRIMGGVAVGILVAAIVAATTAITRGLR